MSYLFFASATSADGTFCEDTETQHGSLEQLETAAVDLLRQALCGQFPLVMLVCIDLETGGASIFSSLCFN